MLIVYNLVTNKCNEHFHEEQVKSRSVFLNAPFKKKEKSKNLLTPSGWNIVGYFSLRNLHVCSIVTPILVTLLYILYVTYITNICYVRDLCASGNLPLQAHLSEVQN